MRRWRLGEVVVTAWIVGSAGEAQVPEISQRGQEGSDCRALAAELGSPYPSVRNAAAAALGTLGPRAACAVDALRTVVRENPDDPEGGNAVKALGQIGPAALSAAPDLMDAALAVSPVMADGVLEALARLGPGVIPYVLPWLDLTRDQFGDLQGNAGFAAITFGRIGAPAIPALLSAIKVPSRRIGSINALAAIGPRAAGAVPVLIETYNRDKDPNVHFAVLKALRDIGPAARQAIPLLERAASTPTDDLLRQTAREALVRIRNKSRE